MAVVEDASSYDAPSVLGKAERSPGADMYAHIPNSFSKMIIVDGSECQGF